MKVLTMLVLASVLGMSSGGARGCARRQQDSNRQSSGGDDRRRSGQGLAAGQDAALRETGIGQEGRRAQGVHENLPVGQEGVSEEHQRKQAAIAVCADLLARLMRSERLSRLIPFLRLDASTGRREHRAVFSTRLRVLAYQQTLQIIALWKIQRHGMIRRSRESLDDHRVRSCVQRGAGDDFLKQVCRDPARA